ncbi:MAG: beta-ketoacyl-ACP synthase II [Actinomycetia bacterium]|nr:beta-ketoacyl-ACP synthase II [Actinomycetes bacterium]MCP4226001.1 beta-ketoacyl-ACP synthase II [Actinomycetes bacterium]
MTAPSDRPPAVAVTGLGVVAPCGIGAEAFWGGLHRQPESGDRRAVPDWDPSPWFKNPKEARRADPFTQYALAAAAMALDQTGDLGADPARIGVFIGTGIGGITTNEEQILIRHEKGDRRVTPFLVPMMMPNAAAAAVSMRHGFEGPCETTVTACAAGTHSIGNAARLITSGRCDVVLAGGSESAMTPTSMAGFGNMTALSKSGVSMPFDQRRDGFIMGEGAGVLVLEELDRAVARGAEILGLILGSASTADAHHITAPAPGGVGAVRCMELAIADAGLSASDIVHVNAHGTSTPLNDAAEAEALAKVFGAPGPIVTSTKGVTGHALGAAGALEAVAVALSMQHHMIPPTLGLEQFDPELPPIDVVVGEARSWEPGPTLSNSFGFGGHNGSIVIAPAPRS